MAKTIKITIALSMLLGTANGIIHILLFIYRFNYPNELASICFYAILATWIVSFSITKTEGRDIGDCINQVLKNKLLFSGFVLIWLYTGVLGLLGVIRYGLWRISFTEPITPERAKIISAGFILFFYVPVLLLSTVKQQVTKADSRQ